MLDENQFRFLLVAIAGCSGCVNPSAPVEPTPDPDPPGLTATMEGAIGLEAAFAKILWDEPGGGFGRSVAFSANPEGLWIGAPGAGYDDILGYATGDIRFYPLPALSGDISAGDYARRLVGRGSSGINIGVVEVPGEESNLLIADERPAENLQRVGGAVFVEAPVDGTDLQMLPGLEGRQWAGADGEGLGSNLLVWQETQAEPYVLISGTTPPVLWWHQIPLQWGATAETAQGSIAVAGCLHEPCAAAFSKAAFWWPATGSPQVAVADALTSSIRTFDVIPTAAAEAEDASRIIRAPGLSIVALESGDLDDDGVEDLVFAAAFEDTVRVVSGDLGPGDVQLSEVAQSQLRSSASNFGWGNRLAIGDFDGDGDDDLAVRQPNSPEGADGWIDFFAGPIADGASPVAQIRSGGAAGLGEVMKGVERSGRCDLLLVTEFDAAGGAVHVFDWCEITPDEPASMTPR